MNRLVIIGAGGHGRVAYDVAVSMKKYSQIIFLDDSPDLALVTDGKVDKFIDYVKDSDFFVAVGDNFTRKKLFELLELNNANIVSLIHNKSIISDKVNIDKGTIIMPGVVINNNVQIKKGVIINTASSIDHDCIVGEFSHIAVGTHLTGGISVGKNVLLGAGSVVINNLSIVDNSIIGAGSTVIRDIKQEGTYVGTPAKKVK